MTLTLIADGTGRVIRCPAQRNLPTVRIHNIMLTPSPITLRVYGTRRLAARRLAAPSLARAHRVPSPVSPLRFSRFSPPTLLARAPCSRRPCAVLVAHAPCVGGARPTRRHHHQPRALYARDWWSDCTRHTRCTRHTSQMETPRKGQHARVEAIGAARRSWQSRPCFAAETARAIIRRPPACSFREH